MSLNTIVEKNLEKALSSTEYDFKNLQYPKTLGEKEDPHYMIFYINVDSQSKYQGSSASTVDGVLDAEQNRVSTDISGSNIGSIISNVGEKISASLGDILPEYVTGAVSKTIDNFGSTDLAKGISDAFAGEFSKTTKRKNRAIVLPVPTNLQSDYGINWESGDLGIAAGLFDSASKTQSQEMMAESGKIVSQIMARAGVRLGAAAINNPLLKRAAGGDILNGGNIVDKMTRTAVNPRKEQLFKNVSFRKFNFSWNLVPKDASEAKVIKDIIYEFKLHMHPELTTGGFFYVYPSEFDLKFYFKGAENTWLNKISTCVLTDMKVNYTPNNDFVTYNDGVTDSVKLDLSFTELELLTKERVEIGF